MKKQKRKKKKSNTGRISFLCIGVFLIMVFSIQMVRLYQKDQYWENREKVKSEEVRDLEKENEKLSEKEEKAKSEESTKEIARSKLGLVFDNEIIFREK